MKKLLILRHGKSEITGDTASDHERPLSSRGKKNCVEISGLMQKNDLFPELIITSTARRAVETSESIRDLINPEIEISTTNRLYLAPPEKHLREITKTNEEVETLLIVGHNPGVEDLINSFLIKEEKIQTCNLAAFYIDIKKWKDLSLKSKILKFKIYRPKD